MLTLDGDDAPWLDTSVDRPVLALTDKIAGGEDDENYGDDKDEKPRLRKTKKQTSPRKSVKKRPASRATQDGGDGGAHEADIGGRDKPEPKPKTKRSKKQQPRAEPKKAKKTKEKDAKPEKRDRSKNKKFNKVWEGLSGEVRDYYMSLSTRSQKTSFINNNIERSDGKLVPKASIMYKHEAKKVEKVGSGEKLKGCVLAEAVGKVGSMDAKPGAVTRSIVKGLEVLGLDVGKA